jgi:deoxyribodipyrimidine photo-lyase
VNNASRKAADKHRRPNRSGKIIVWIRKELRLRDNLLLWSAVQDACEVIPVFIVSDVFLKTTPPPSLKVIFDGVDELKTRLQSIGGDLFIRIGEEEEQLHKLLAETGAEGVYVGRSYEPDVHRNDERIGRSFIMEGRVWKEINDHVIFEGMEIKTSTGKPYEVFSAYRKTWLSRRGEILPAIPMLRSLPTFVVKSLPLPIPEKIYPALTSMNLPQGGEAAGATALKGFLENGLSQYHVQRDVPAMIKGTSRLSHHLASGSLSVRTVYHEIMRSAKNISGPGKLSVSTFLNEIIWREFYYQILMNYPHVAVSSFKQKFMDIVWAEDPQKFSAWCLGQTGYPIVDAAMRQLRSEGWMHNRCRMIVASFLTKDLHIHWQLGEQYFKSMLADYDLASNNGGWQWSAGTGTDAQPWFRIFNPVLQSKKFDPHGEYIFRYVPELRVVPRRYIHAPWLMPAEVQRSVGCIIGKHYTHPIVEHEVERKRALRFYSAQGRREDVKVKVS